MSDCGANLKDETTVEYLENVLGLTKTVIHLSKASSVCYYLHNFWRGIIVSRRRLDCDVEGYASQGRPEQMLVMQVAE